MEFYETPGQFIDATTRRLQLTREIDLPTSGRITNVLISTKKNGEQNYSITGKVPEIFVDGQGILGDRHYGWHRQRTGREHSFPKGVMVRNHRHLLAVSRGDCIALSARLKDSRGEISPELLGANLVIEREDGLEYQLSNLPVGVQMHIYEGGKMIAALQNQVLQRGCATTADEVMNAYGADRKLATKFVQSALANRGILCSVEFPAQASIALRPNQIVQFKYPMNASR